MISWDPFYLNLNSYFVIISTLPMIIQLKINLTLTTSIAAERTLALYFPVVFRSLSTRSYAVFSLLCGILLAVLDVILEFSLTPFNSALNCVAIGCFLSETFRYYWGISNMVNLFFKAVYISVKCYGHDCQKTCKKLNLGNVEPNLSSLSKISLCNF
ncbi:unnamed protein product [Angiostrongylus costaricensis]|uniref:Serpentine receptor class gamma n=1 Tax=Angiostrongylus costaricensis TaxID=334426 RepID=A0A0R3PBN5_ANGCS|nr:unnamed protein product [Angiostrongylus costaricensis]